jgi:3-oxoadipate enol-lactonase
VPFHTRAGGGPRLYYRLDGHPGKPLLVLGNSLGTDVFMWEPQMAAFTEHYRVLRMDTRGHGASDVPAGDASIGDLGRDVLAVLDELGVERYAFCGLSLGAMVGQWLGVHAPQRLDALVLSNASPFLPPPEAWSARIDLVRRDGMQAIVDAVMPRFFSQPYRDRDEPFFHTMRTAFLATSAQGYAACCAAVRDADFRPLLRDIRIPTLVIAGALDAATPADPHSHLLRDGIAGARYATLQAGHIANVEQPEAFSRAVLEFLRAS